MAESESNTRNKAATSKTHEKKLLINTKIYLLQQQHAAAVSAQEKDFKSQKELKHVNKLTKSLKLFNQSQQQQQKQKQTQTQIQKSVQQVEPLADNSKTNDCPVNNTVATVAISKATAVDSINKLKSMAKSLDHDADLVKIKSNLAVLNDIITAPITISHPASITTSTSTCAPKVANTAENRLSLLKSKDHDNILIEVKRLCFFVS